MSKKNISEVDCLFNIYLDSGEVMTVDAPMYLQEIYNDVHYNIIYEDYYDKYGPIDDVEYLGIINSSDKKKYEEYLRLRNEGYDNEEALDMLEEIF